MMPRPRQPVRDGGSRPVRLLLAAAAVVFTTAVVSAQYVLPAPASRQPTPLAAPRIPPVPEAQWTDEQKQLVAKYAFDGKADNALKTLLNLPALVDGVMPYTRYLLEESSLTPRQREL